MSEQPDQQQPPAVNPDTTVTFSLLEKWAAGFVGVIKQEIGSMLKESEERTLNTISQNTAQQMDAQNVRINEIVQWINTQQQQSPAPQQQQQQQGGGIRSRVNIGELGSQIREIIAAAREANIIPGDQPSELQRWGMAAAETAQREALLSIKRQVRAGMKRGLVDRPTVESIVDETLDRSFGGGGAGHEPVL